MKLYAQDPRKNHPILAGTLDVNTFRKEVNSQKHRLKMFPAYGIQEEVISKLSTLPANIVIEIHETDTGVTYISQLEMWKLEGVVKDLGNGNQRFLSLKYMDTK
jgi:hypothetical protein